MDGQRTYGMDRGTALHFWGGLCGPHVKLGALTGSRAPRTRVTAPARSLQQVPSAAQCPHELPPAQLYQSALWHQPQCKPGRLGDHRGPSRSQPQAPDKQEAPVLCARWLLMTSSPACSAPGGARPASPHPQQRLREADRSEMKVGTENVGRGAGEVQRGRTGSPDQRTESEGLPAGSGSLGCLGPGVGSGAAPGATGL